MDLNTILLSRIQFGFTIGFHILFPTLNIGLAAFLCIMEGIWLKTQNPIYLKICKFWTKIFALTFGLGIVSGIVLSYELGTNFGQFINAVGGVLGPLFGYEVLSAFFLEAGFLGIMLFGWERVGPKLHYLATLLVTLGTMISAFWIMSANSWMQTPSGYDLVNGKFIVTNWWHVVFNPSVIPRFTHMLMASWVTSTFVIAGIAAWYLLKRQHLDTAKPVFSLALGLAIFLTPMQVFLGDRVGLAVHQYQPVKTAAIEALWHSEEGAPLVLFGFPDTAQQKNLYALTIPYGASWINTHHLKGRLEGLNDVSSKDWPIIPVVFYSFRIMVGIGLLLFAIALWGLFLRIRKKLFTTTIFLRTCLLISPLGFLATIAGWLTAETGRQPWIVYGLLRTSEGASQVPGTNVAISLSFFILVYSIILSFYCYYLFKFIRKGPEDISDSAITIGYLQKPEHRELKP